MVAKTIKRPRFAQPLSGAGFAAGLTLVEVMAAMAVLAIAALGASAFRYHAALGARKADLQTTAARTALLLCESWRGVSNPSTFDPTQLATSGPNSALAIETITIYEGHAVPADFTPLGTYGITINDVNYYAVLSWKDVSPGLRALNVIVAWDQRGSGPSSGGGNVYDWGSVDASKSFKLTTYVVN